MGHLLTAATIHLSLLSYLLATVCWVTFRRGTAYRSLWTAGCVFLLTHAICAFHFYLGWSHSAAVSLTADQTNEMLGFQFGEGIWFSYLLLVVWTIDVVQIWRQPRPDPESHPDAKLVIQPTWYSRAVHAYAFFILFNGTVVFEDGLVRWGGIVGTIWLARMAWRFRKKSDVNRATELAG